MTGVWAAAFSVRSREHCKSAVDVGAGGCDADAEECCFRCWSHSITADFVKTRRTACVSSWLRKVFFKNIAQIIHQHKLTCSLIDWNVAFILFALRKRSLWKVQSLMVVGAGFFLTGCNSCCHPVLKYPHLFSTTNRLLGRTSLLLHLFSDVDR